MIKVQEQDFEIGAELASLTDGNTAVGGLGCFVGLVRDMANDEQISSMTLEHYPGMTEKQLAATIEAEARDRWPLLDVLIIHRYGRLEPGDRIVLVGTDIGAPRSGTRELSLPDRLAQDQSAVLEARRIRYRRKLGRRPRLRRRCCRPLERHRNTEKITRQRRCPALSNLTKP